MFESSTGILSISGFSDGIKKNGDLIDWTPGKELVPQNLIESLFNTFVTVDVDLHRIEVNPNNAAFVQALAEYAEDAANKGRKFPVIRLNALEGGSFMNENSETRWGQTSTFRTSSQIGSTVINSYGTWLGSSKGPGWKYSIGGVDILHPSGLQLLAGDYIIKTGSLLATGFNHGFIGEKYFASHTKVGASIGAIQTSLTRIGLQTQRPIFKRNEAMFFSTFDSDDFLERRAFKNNFWQRHHILAGAGAGGFGDNKAHPLHGGGVLSYAYGRDSFNYFGGRLVGDTAMEVGVSDTKRERIPGTKRLHPGGVIIFRQNTTLYDRLTFTTLYQRGSQRWSTLDTSNVFRNQTLFNEGISLRVIKGVNIFGSFAFNQPTDKSAPPSKTWAGGAQISLLPTILPEASWSTNVQTTPHTTARYFNTMFVNQPLNILRSNINGVWIFSNSGNNNTMQSSFSLTEKTTLYKNVIAYWNKQWVSPDSTNTQVGVDSGRLLGNLLTLNFGIGQADSKVIKQSNWRIGGSILVPWIGQRIGFAYNQVSKSFQFQLNLQGFWGRNGVLLNSATAPTRVEIPKGRLVGRFFVDNDLNGVFDPVIDRPLPGMKIITNNSIAGVTDEAGKYVVNNLTQGFLGVATDPSAVPASFAFMTPTRQDVFILPNRTRTIDFRFAKLAKLSGTISSPNKDTSSVKDIRLFLDGTDRDTLTDENGAFSITDVPPGKYLLKIDPDYLQRDQQAVEQGVTIDLKPGEKLKNIVFTLKEKPPEVEEKHF